MTTLTTLTLTTLTTLTLALLAGCPENQDFGDVITLVDDDAVAAYAADAPEVEERDVFITADVSDLSPFASSALRAVARFDIGNTTALTDLAGLAGLRRVGDLVVDQNLALREIELDIEEAGDLSIQGHIDVVHLDRLARVDSFSITGQACDISFDALVDVGECVINNDRAASGCEPPNVTAFPACPAP